MTTDYSPKPWRLDEEGPGDILAADGSIVAHVYQYDDFPCIEEPYEVAQPEFEATALAIVTAVNQYPALLAAAKLVIELWDRWMATNSPDRPSVQDLDAAIDALRPSSAPWYAAP